MRTMRILFPVVLIATLVSGCIREGGAMPIVVSLDQDGSLIVQAPICQGDVLESAGIDDIVDGEYLAVMHGDDSRIVSRDTVLTLDLSVAAVSQGQLTPQWPVLDRSPIDVSGGLPEEAELSVTTRDYFVGVYLKSLQPSEDEWILVMGRATRAGDADKITVVDEVTATETLRTWCDLQREESE